MDINREIVYIGSVFAGGLGAFLWTKFQTQSNTKDIEKLEAQINEKIDSKLAVLVENVKEHNNKIQAGFKKVDKFEERISTLETASTHFLTFEKAKEHYPSKESFELILRELKDADKAVMEEVKDLKKEISNIEKKLDKHMEEDRANQSTIISLLQGGKK